MELSVQYTVSTPLRRVSVGDFFALPNNPAPRLVYQRISGKVLGDRGPAPETLCRVVESGKQTWLGADDPVVPLCIVRLDLAPRVGTVSRTPVALETSHAR